MAVFWKWPEKFFCCGLKFLGIVLGCIGMAYRIVAIVLLSIQVTQLGDTSKLFYILFYLAIGYCTLSLSTNLLFNAGIILNQCYLMLPYIGIEIIDLIMMFIGLIVGITLLSATDNSAYLAMLIPLGLILIITSFYFWLCMASLFKRMEEGKQKVSAPIEMPVLQLNITL